MYKTNLEMKENSEKDYKNIEIETKIPVKCRFDDFNIHCYE